MEPKRRLLELLLSSDAPSWRVRRIIVEEHGRDEPRIERPKRKVVFSLDERSLVNLPPGGKEIVVRNPKTGEERTMMLPKVEPACSCGPWEE